jgi:hypothetical protein
MPVFYSQRVRDKNEIPQQELQEEAQRCETFSRQIDVTVASGPAGSGPNALKIKR